MAYFMEQCNMQPVLEDMKTNVIKELQSLCGANNNLFNLICSDINTYNSSNAIRDSTRGYSINNYLNMCYWRQPETALKYQQRHQNNTNAENFFLFDENTAKLSRIQTLLHQVSHSTDIFITGDILSWIKTLIMDEKEQIYTPNPAAHFLQQLVQLLWCAFFLNQYLLFYPEILPKI